MADHGTLTTEQARALIAAESNLTILDLRDHRSYRAGHIDGALLLHDGLMQSIIKRNQLDAPILLYCYRGVQSAERAEVFGDLGSKHVYSLEGGYTEWSKSGAAAARSDATSALSCVSSSAVQPNGAPSTPAPSSKRTK
jgi:thiosulfate sulfurtransferase